MTEAELKRWTKAFALRVLKLADVVPEKRSARVLASQLACSGTSVGANYRAACRSRSAAEMISKLAVLEEEPDESGFCLELIGEHGLRTAEKPDPLLKDANELTAIMVASPRTLGSKNRKSGIGNRK